MRTDDETISPELVLVDPVLAASARARLDEPAPRPATRSGVPRTSVRDHEVGLPAAGAGQAGPRRRHERRSWPVLAGVAVALVVGLLLLDVRVEIGRTPAAAGDPEGDRTASPVSEPAPTPRATPRTGAAPAATPALDGRAVPRTFSWAAAAGASAYHVELFRGPTRVFAANVARPELKLPVRWEHAGEQRTLTSGEYRWYVWPLAGGRRATTAVVQATLVVP